jgi:hypothetical protein
VVGPQAAAAGAGLLPPPPSMAVWIEAERGRAQIEHRSIFFLFFQEMTHFIGPSRPMKATYFSSALTKTT